MKRTEWDPPGTRLGEDYLPPLKPRTYTLTPHRRWLAGLPIETRRAMWARWSFRREVYDRVRRTSWDSAEELAVAWPHAGAVAMVQRALESLERLGYLDSYGTARSRRYSRADRGKPRPWFGPGSGRLRDSTHAAIDEGLERLVKGTVLVVDPFGRVELVPDERLDAASDEVGLYVPALQAIECPDAGGRWAWCGWPRWQRTLAPVWHYGNELVRPSFAAPCRILWRQSAPNERPT